MYEFRSSNASHELSTVSVIVCTKNRPTQLVNCLRSIVSTDWPCRELLVVDSSVSSIAKKNEILAKSLGARYLHESRSGLSYARNRGMVEGTGRFIVFADDDFIARKRWVLNLVRNMANANVICCTGRMISHRQDETSELFERSLGFDKGQKKRLFSRRDISLSSLFVSVRAIRGRLGGDAPVPWCVGNGYFSLVREAVNTVGSFDESLGVGTPSRGGEEVDMFYRILKSGRTIVYDPEAVIYHDHRPNYFTLKTAAYNAGASERAFASKYFGTDLYCTIFFLGALSLRVLQFIMNAVKQRRAVSDLELLKLCGFLHVPRNGI